MPAIPSALQKQFEEYLQNKLIPNSSRGAYKKWLRYYLDFCQKNNVPPMRKESLPHFIRKLQEKKQAKVQQEQAVKAITLYYDTVKAKELSNKKPMLQTSSPPAYVPFKDKKHFSVHEAVARPVRYKKGYVERENGASWEAEYSLLADEIHVRPYSSQTLKSYKGWVRKFQTFTRSKTPELLSANDVKEFLTFLAVNFGFLNAWVFGCIFLLFFGVR